MAGDQNAPWTPPATPHGGPPPPRAGHAAPGPPPGPSPAPVPVGYLDLTLQGNEFSSSIVAPRVRVNGWRVATRYGRQVLAVPAGPIRVDVEAQWWRTYGRATLDLTLAPGQTVPVFYASPYHVFGSGAIGHTRQKRPGMGGLLVTIAVTLVLAAGATVAALLALG